MSLWEEIQPWIDKETGLMTAPDGGRDNLILMTAYLVRAIENSKGREGLYEISTSKWKFLTKVTSCYGLYRRLPDSTDDNSVDNLIATCYLGAAQFILYRWRDYWTCFDVNNPKKFALNRNFYGRFIGLKAFIIACNWKKPSLFQRLLWCASVVWSVHTSKGASNPLLMSLQVDRMDQYCPRAAAYWKKHYSLKQLYTEFLGADFPVTRYTNG